MKTTSLILATTALVASTASGLPVNTDETAFQCKDDAGCATGEKCYKTTTMSKCVPRDTLGGTAPDATAFECTDDAGCATGEKCYKTTTMSKCVPRDTLGGINPDAFQCKDDAGCATGEKCYKTTTMSKCVQEDKLGGTILKCTEEELRACKEDVLPTLPECSADVRPTWDTTACCPSCRKPAITIGTVCPKPEACTDGNTSTRDSNGCVTCINKCFTVTTDSLRSCKEKMMADNFPVCVDGPPERTEDCCYSCKPDVQAIPTGIKPSEPCECTTSFTQLETCEAGVKPTFDDSTCCRTCKPEMTVIRTALANKKCTKEQYKQCVAERAECEGRESRDRTDGCCKSCARPAEKCSIQEAIKECRNTPVCEEDQMPTRVEGSCCFSCRPKPRCTRDCAAEGKVCTRKGCMARKTRKIALRVAEKVKAAAANRDLQKEDAQALLVEVVERFCDRTDDARALICADEASFIDALRVKMLKTRSKVKNRAGEDAEEVDIEVEVADAAAATRRLLASGDLLDQALGDSDATDGIAEQVETDENVNGATTALFSMATFAGAFFL